MPNFRLNLSRYLWNLLIALDQLGNALTGGEPDETISSRCGKRLRAGKPCRVCRALCRWLAWLDPGHCAEAIEDDEPGRA